MDDSPLKRGRGRPKGSKNQPKPGALKGTAQPRDPFKNPNVGETKIGHMLCARFSFKNLASDGSPVIILCHNAYPSHTTFPGEYRCPDWESCLNRWSRAKEEYEYQKKQEGKQE